jgi:hypothetical protein
MSLIRWMDSIPEQIIRRVSSVGIKIAEPVSVTLVIETGAPGTTLLMGAASIDRVHDADKPATRQPPGSLLRSGDSYATAE